MKRGHVFKKNQMPEPIFGDFHVFFKKLEDGICKLTDECVALELKNKNLEKKLSSVIHLVESF